MYQEPIGPLKFRWPPDSSIIPLPMSAKRIPCPAGKWTTLVSNFGSGMAKTFEIELHGEGVIDGEFEEKAAAWIFPRPARTGSLAPSMRFHRKWINAIYKLRIKPTTDVTATVR